MFVVFVVVGVVAVVVVVVVIMLVSGGCGYGVCDVCVCFGVVVVRVGVCLLGGVIGCGGVIYCRVGCDVACLCDNVERVLCCVAL